MSAIISVLLAPGGCLCDQPNAFGFMPDPALEGIVMEIIKTEYQEYHLMAQAVATAIGANKRQVQLWTDRGVLRCRGGALFLGTGKQRLYDEPEFQVGRFVAILVNAMQVPVGVLFEGAEWYRERLDLPPMLAASEFLMKRLCAVKPGVQT